VSDEQLIIIGAGVAGLAAGCYACMNGYDVRIFEMHTLPGGMCTSWRRKDYVFDYCIHNLAGTAPESDVRRVWDELGALDETRIINHDSFVRIEGPGGESLEWYTRLDRLAQHLNGIAAEDSRTIDELIQSARRLVGADVFALQLGGMARSLGMLTRMPTVRRWSRVKLGQFAERFRNPFLRRALPHMQYDIPGAEVPMLAPLMFMAGFESGDLGWPVGGSLAFSRRIEKRYLDLGGVLHYKAKVEKIMVEDDRAVGIRLADGTEHRADRIISAADGYSTIFKMLDGRYLNETIRQYYNEVGDSSPFGYIMFLGLEGELPREPFGEGHALTLIFDKPLDLGEIEQDSIHVVGFGPETGLTPEGRSILKIEGQARYPYWKSLHDTDPQAYIAEKERVAGVIIQRISPWFPMLEDRVEVMNISTPPTVERFTGNRYGWQAGPPKENAAEIMRKGLSRTLPGLERFHMVGQWASAQLGISSVAIQARSFIKGLCRQARKRFVVNG